MAALGQLCLSSCIVRLMHLKPLTWGDLQKSQTPKKCDFLIDENISQRQHLWSFL